MDAGVPLATIQRWLGHANISQTSKYLAATLGGDADEMRAYEQRSAGCHKLTYPPDRTELNRPQSDTAVTEKTQSKRDCALTGMGYALTFNQRAVGSIPTRVTT